MADQKLHSLCPEKNVFCRYCVTNQAGLSIATRHWVKFSRKPICIFLDSLKSMHSATECNSQRDLVCIGAIPLKNFRSRDYEIMRRQDLVRELVRSEDPQSWNIPDVGNELSSNCSSKELRPKPKNFLWKRFLCQKSRNLLPKSNMVDVFSWNLIIPRFLIPLFLS